MNVYKINDIISCEFLKIPKAMFANKSYRSLSSDAKLTYALLYDRLSLSKLNGWINENEEVYLIYTREEITEDLGITYKKAISAFVPSQQKWTQKSFKKRNESYSFFCFRKTAAFIPRFA